MKVDGHCHCGAIAWEGEVDPDTVRICHCVDCQSLSGSPYRAVIATPAEHFRFLRGQPITYIKTTADSGNPRAHAFCGACGSPIYATAAENPTSYALRIGALTQRDQLRPQRQIWCRSALPWAMDIEAVDQSAGQ